MDAQLKISRAITNLAFNQPFFGSCLLQLKVEEAPVPTLCTNGVDLFWGRSFVETLNEDETRGCLAHEVMHVVLKHCIPHPGKDPTVVNIAMDWVINRILIDQGFTLPEGALLDPEERTNSWAWEEVYKFLMNVKEDKPKPLEGTPDAGGRVYPGEVEAIKKQIEGFEEGESHIEEGPSSEEDNSDNVDDMIIKASNAQEASGRGCIPGEIERRIKGIREPKIHWAEEFENRVMSLYPEDYTFQRPNKKFMQQGLYLPSMRGQKPGVIAIAIDTSGSMTEECLTKAASETNYIINVIKPEKVLLMSSDHAVSNVKEYDSGAYFTLEEFKAIGGGGTSFRPVFEYLEKTSEPVDQLIYFSDMYVLPSDFPNKEPEFQTTFVSTTGRSSAPFGKVICMKDY
jgi:predicted metal-dependent peptidase